MSADIFDEMGLEADAEVIASEAVATAGLKRDTIDAGIYLAEALVVAKPLRDPARPFQPNRPIVNIRFVIEEPKKSVFARLSWEPTDETDTGQDKMTRLYSNLETALDMYGERVIDVIKACHERAFRIEVVEAAMVMVGKLPEKQQIYHIETRGRGEAEEVWFEVKAGDDETRTHLLRASVNLKNYIKAIMSE